MTWACVPRGGAGAEPPGGAPGADTRPAVARSLETLLFLPGTSPQSPDPGTRGWSSGLRKAEPGAIDVGTGVAGRAPGFPGSRGVSARCPASARRAPQLGWGDRLVQVSGPRVPRRPPPPVNYAGGWHRCAQVAQVSLATFARASLPAAGQLRPRSPAQAPPQGGRGSGLGERAWRHPPRTRHLSWGRWIARAGATPTGDLAAQLRRTQAAPNALTVGLCAAPLRGMGGRARGRGSCFPGAEGVQRGRGRCW